MEVDGDEEDMLEEGADEDGIADAESEERMDLDTSHTSQRTPTARRSTANPLSTAPVLRDFRRTVPIFSRATVATFNVDNLQSRLDKLMELVKNKGKDAPNLRVAMDYLEKVG